MEPIVQLLQQMSFENLFLLLALVLAATKAFGELFDWCYSRLKSYFGNKGDEVDFQKEILKRLDNIDKKTNATDEKLEQMGQTLHVVQERLQNSTRSYIIDKFHYYVYQIGSIDEAALQDLERRYLYYKEAGGDTFIETRMKALRELPLITADQMAQESQDVVDNLHHMLGTDDNGR